MLVVWNLQGKEFWVMVSEKHRKSKTLLILLVPNTKPQLAIKNSFLLLCIREDALVLNSVPCLNQQLCIAYNCLNSRSFMPSS